MGSLWRLICLLWPFWTMHDTSIHYNSLRAWCGIPSSQSLCRMLNCLFARDITQHYESLDWPCSLLWWRTCRAQPVVLSRLDGGHPILRPAVHQAWNGSSPRPTDRSCNLLLWHATHGHYKFVLLLLGHQFYKGNTAPPSSVKSFLLILREVLFLMTLLAFMIPTVPAVRRGETEC